MTVDLRLQSLGVHYMLYIVLSRVLNHCYLSSNLFVVPPVRLLPIEGIRVYLLFEATDMPSIESNVLVNLNLNNGGTK